MYGLAYVIIPTEFASLQAALDESLAPFRRGGVDNFPRDSLAFDDATDNLRRLHVAEVSMSCGNGLSLRWEDPEPPSDFDLDFGALRDFVRSNGAAWSGRLSDVEPDFHAFARRFSRWKRDPETGGYGQWLNPLGRWDWWELGGRFDGVVSGEKRAGAGSESMISSGPNRGRDLLGGVARARRQSVRGRGGDRRQRGPGVRTH